MPEGKIYFKPAEEPYGYDTPNGYFGLTDLLLDTNEPKELLNVYYPFVSEEEYLEWFEVNRK